MQDALCEAVAILNVSIVSMLLDAKAQVNNICANGTTALAMTIRRQPVRPEPGTATLSSLQREGKATVASQSSESKTVKMDSKSVASRAKQDSLAIVKLLLADHADVDLAAPSCDVSYLSSGVLKALSSFC